MKGTTSDPGNYRPVSLTSIVCKVLESLIEDTIVAPMNTHTLDTECSVVSGNTDHVLLSSWR